ncbi:MAG TPA: glycosyltransferase [Acidimicrobiia bacterium]
MTAPTGNPRVSVVVPVRDRRDLLVELLRALEAQSYRDFEVVVVDDGSSDGSDKEAEQAVIAGRPVRVLRLHELGAVAAREEGVAAAAADVLAFTDSDCAPEPEWLSAGMAAIEAGADMVHGRTVPARPMRPLERSVGAGDEGLFPMCNVFYRRAAFDAVGGFDQAAARRLGFRMNARARGLGFGEDTLLGWRVSRSGGDVRYAPDAVVRHHVFPPDFRDWVSRCWMAAAFPALLADVPELRPRLVRRGVMFGERSRVPLYTAAIALAARRPRIAAAAGAWWALARWQELRSTPAPVTERLAALPQELGLDVVTGAALAVGSARARRLLI